MLTRILFLLDTRCLTRMSELSRFKQTLTRMIFLVIGLLSNGRPLFVSLSSLYLRLFVAVAKTIKLFFFILFHQCDQRASLSLSCNYISTVCILCLKKFCGLLVIGEFEAHISAPICIRSLA